MSLDRIAAPSGDAELQVREWRRSRLLAAGFEDALARRLAGDGGIDLHAVLVLVDRGCPPELAARILAPLEDQRPSSRVTSSSSES